jgi:hypothetical protein
MMSAYRSLNMAVPKSEFEIYRSFFESHGGFTNFVKESMTKAGFRDRESLKELAKRVRTTNIQECQEFDHLVGEGIE